MTRYTIRNLVRSQNVHAARLKLLKLLASNPANAVAVAGAMADMCRTGAVPQIGASTAAESIRHGATTI